MVLDSLPDGEKAFWADARKHFLAGPDTESSFFPDWHPPHAPAERRKLVAPYALEIEGVPFHNFLVEPETSEGRGSWQTNTEKNWRFATTGFDYYLTASVRSLKEGRARDASGFMNWLCHVLQDQASFIHSLQGPGGLQPFFFKEFFGPPPGRSHQTATDFLGEECPEVTLKGYTPRLLGTTVPEAAFHLYHRYRQVNRHTRRLLIPLIQSGYAEDAVKHEQIRESIALEVSRLLADLFHTVYCLSGERFSADQTAPLDTVDMTELFPVEYPNHASSPYRFSPVVKGACLSNGEPPERVPLRLNLHRSDQKDPVTFDHGLGTGAHYKSVISYGIPTDVYGRVELAVGLHEPLGRRGHVSVSISLDETQLFQREFSGSARAEPFTADVSPGGILRWTVCALTEQWSDANNHVVWGAPTLIKR